MNVKVTNNKKQTLDELQQQSLVALEACGLAGEGWAKDLLTQQKAVDTGDLRRSVKHKVQPAKMTCFIGTNIKYAPYIEFGTGKFAEGGGRPTPWVWQDKNGDWHMTHGMKARPYLRPAVADHIKDYKKIIEEYLDQ